MFERVKMYITTNDSEILVTKCSLILYNYLIWVIADESNQTKFSKPLKFIELVFVLFLFERAFAQKSFIKQDQFPLTKHKQRKPKIKKKKKKSMRKTPLNFYWISDKEGYEEISQYSLSVVL